MIPARGKSIKLRVVFLIMAGLSVISGCAAVIVGAGAGASTYAYAEGAVKRSYSSDYEKTYRACVGILKDLNQPIIKETTDGGHTTITTERSDQTPMTITLTILEPGRTEVSVRTGTVGLWKRDVSEQYHKFIAQRLEKNSSP